MIESSLLLLCVCVFLSTYIWKPDSVIMRICVNLAIALLKVSLNVIDYTLSLGIFISTGLCRYFWPGHEERKRVVILGGSFAGLVCQRELSDKYDVTVIDMRNYFEYTPGILRVFVEQSFLSSITCAMPSSRNTFLHAKVVGVEKNCVDIVYNDGATDSIPFDYLIVGTGSSYVSPIKPQENEPTLKERESVWRGACEKLEAAKSVLIVGAGPVGVELAGEIMTEFPDKKVALVDGAPHVCAQFPYASKVYMQEWLTSRGAQLYLDKPIAGKFPDLEITDTGCTLVGGQKLEADIVYKCLGFKANAAFMAKSFGKSLDRVGRLIVNQHLQLAGHTNIFAMGDCMLTEHEVSGRKPREIKVAHTAEVNAHMVVKNLLALSNGQPLGSYPEAVTGGVPTPIIYCVSLGKYDGTLGMNWLIMNGCISAITKWLLEYTKVMAVQERPLGIFFWKLADFMSMLLARTVLKKQAATTDPSEGQGKKK